MPLLAIAVAEVVVDARVVRAQAFREFEKLDGGVEFCFDVTRIVSRYCADAHDAIMMIANSKQRCLQPNEIFIFVLSSSNSLQSLSDCLA